ncbi:hypothetical protein D3C87_253530 [compost metagenome]
MKNKVLSALLVLSVLWASASTFLYLTLKNNPKVVAITTGEMNKSNMANFQLSEMEQLSFVRQFVEQYFNYTSNNFWQTQTTLAFLMDSPLRQKRIEEVSRLREKIQKKTLSQKALLKSITLEGADTYKIDLTLQINEEGQAPQELPTQAVLQIKATERTLENPWGLLITSMDFASNPPTSFDSVMSLKEQSPSVATFPCAIENIENPQEDTLKTKITTLNVSELQLMLQKPLNELLILKAFCKNNEFSIVVQPSTKRQTLFKSFPMTAAVERKVDTSKGPRKKDIYEKTIEDVLGIKVE